MRSWIGFRRTFFGSRRRSATSLAVSEEQAGGRYIDRLSDYSLEGLRRLRGIWEAALAELGRLNRASLQARTP